MKYILFGHTPVEIEDTLVWGEWFKTGDRVVARTELENGSIVVSTVFLGLDHNRSGYGPPILFETLVFGGDYAGRMERYATWEEAEAGHEQMVRKIKGE